MNSFDFERVETTQSSRTTLVEALIAAFFLVSQLFAQQRGPLQLSEVEELLSIRVPDSFLAASIRTLGVAFPVSPENLDRLAGLGASKSVLDALRSAAPTAGGNPPAAGDADKLTTPGQAVSREEQRLLQEAVSQAGNSPVEFIRVAERHLKKFPQSVLRENLEKAILIAAVDAKDHGRIISYGEKGLQWGEDPALLDRVARALLESDDPESARRAVKYAERLEKAAAAKSEPQVVARALALQARAWGNTGEVDKAIALARKSYDTFPNGEAAREAGRWEVRAGRIEQAIEHYADAFSILDPKVTAENRAHHLALLGELYRKLHGSEAGLGDLILKAYDRTSQAVKARENLVKTANPNSGVLDGLQFHLAGLRGDSIRLADFHGKVIVLDFWATWCAPCRFQHPLLEQLRTKYKDDPGVAFVSINTDQDRAAVKPFIEQLHWSDQVYFDDGLARFYRVISIPTTMIFNRAGDLVTRLPGFDESYVELLTGKIEEARRD